MTTRKPGQVFPSDSKKYKRKPSDKARVLEYAKKYQAQKKAEDPDAWARYRKDKVLKSDFGISLDQFEQMLKDQEGRCAICEDPMDPPHVDHDHACCKKRPRCGKCVRRLLCRACNHGLGNFKDDISRLQTAIQYLNDYKESE